MVQENPDRWDINVPTAKKAYDRGVKIFAAPWNAPDELLEPGDGPDTLAHDHYDEYADHLNSYNTFMENNGVDLYGMSIQNEPDHGSTWTGWTPDELLTFMKDHASAIDTRIIAPESFQFRRNVSDPLLNDEQAREELDIVGGHIYGGGLEPYPLAKSLGKEVWMTEHLDTTTTYNAVLATGKEIHDCLAVADFNAYVWWYIKRFYGPTSEDGDVSKRGYVMSHYSRFIRPGYHRIDATQNPQTDIFVSAYTGEDKTVIVALNMGSESVNQQFVTENGDDAISSFTPHVTTSDENVSEKEPVSLSSDGSSFEFEIPAQSIVTFVGD
jgi:glucuronoarabinoxylan endo-1,4-beta-xylanase